MLKKKRLKKRQTLQSKILLKILEGQDLLSPLFDWSYTGPKYFYEASLAKKQWNEMYEDDIERWKQNRVLKELRRKKWIEDRERGGEVIVKLNADAIISVLKDSIRNEETDLPDDGQCIVMFDFPNGATKARNYWRRFLCSADFRMIQLSVFATKKDVVEDTVALAHLLGIIDWVKVYIGKEALM